MLPRCSHAAPTPLPRRSHATPTPLPRCPHAALTLHPRFRTCCARRLPLAAASRRPAVVPVPQHRVHGVYVRTSRQCSEKTVYRQRGSSEPLYLHSPGHENQWNVGPEACNNSPRNKWMEFYSSAARAEDIGNGSWFEYTVTLARTQTPNPNFYPNPNPNPSPSP